MNDNIQITDEVAVMFHGVLLKSIFVASREKPIRLSETSVITIDITKAWAKANVVIFPCEGPSNFITFRLSFLVQGVA